MKIRVKVSHTAPGMKWYYNNSLQYDNFGSIAGPCTKSEALVLSSGHKWPPKDGRDHGGPFWALKSTSRINGVPIDNRYTLVGVPNRWVGRMYAYTPSDISYLNAPTHTPDLDLAALGTTAIANCLPTNPISGLAQFIGEAHELPKMFDFNEWKHQLNHFRKVPHRVFASRFLEYEFGWLPLISDIRSFYKASNNLNKIALQYERDSGRNIRRSRKISSSSSSAITTLSTSFGGVPALTSHAYRSVGRQYKTVTTSLEQWFSGCFTYYLPPIKKPGIIGDYAHYEAITNKLFGQRVTAETVWNLTPWSWAADWVSNAGDVIHNWQAFQRDGLIMRYGYVMEKKTVLTTYSMSGVVLKDGTPVNDVMHYQHQSKYRLPATPYGFGLNPASFTDRQNAIIAALAVQNIK